MLLYDSSSDWASRLLKESATFWSSEIEWKSLNSVFDPFSTSHVYPPFSRLRPVSQRVQRSDGKRPRDGGGLGSPLVVEPGHLQWDDPLAPLRNPILSQVEKSQLPKLIQRLSQLSDWKKTLLDGAPLERCQLGFPSDVPLSAGLEHVSRALLEVQLEIETATKLLADQVLPLAQDSCRSEGWRFLSAIKKGQPFRLDLICECAERCLDPDSYFVRECEQGLGLGVSPPLSVSPHYPLKQETMLKDLDYVAWASSYRSAEEMHEKVLELLQEDIDLGVIGSTSDLPGDPPKGQGLTWPELCQLLRLPKSTSEPDPTISRAQLIPGVAVTRVGCIDERVYDPLGSLVDDKWRLVFDGTAAGVNSQVLLPVVAETPGLLDGEALLGYPTPAADPFLGCKIDVKGAFKRLLLHRDEFPYSIFTIGGKWYFSKSCPMGMRASPYHWCRFNSILHRLTKRLAQHFLHGSMMYIDDSLFAAKQSEFSTVISMILTFLVLMGVPISWKKLEAGLFTEWVGFRLDFSERKAYLSEARLAKIQAQMDSFLGLNRIPLSDFRQLTYRMVWVSQSFPMSKIFLHKFFARLHNKGALKEGYIFNVDSLRPLFEWWSKLIKAARHWVSPVLLRNPTKFSITRTDAAAEPAGIFLGGWFAESLEDFEDGRVSWFAFKVDSQLFPQSKASNNHLISAAEALAVAIAVALWGPQLLQSDSRVAVLGSEKWYTASPNLACAMELLVHACFARHLRLQLSWVAGKDNALADALSRIEVDPKAKSALDWLHASAVRADCEVLFQILPVLQPYLLPLELGGMRCGLWLMLVRSLLTEASSPFRWSEPEADLFVLRTGLTTVAQLSGYICLRGLDHLSSYLVQCLDYGPPEVVRSGAELSVMFRLSWTEYQLGVNRPLAPTLLRAPTPVAGRVLGPAQGPPPLMRPSPGQPVARLSPPPVAEPTPVSEGGKRKRVLPVGKDANLSFPITQKNRKLQQAALAVARDPVRFEKARDDLRGKFFAESTVASHLSQLTLYTQLCKERGIQDFPVSQESLELLVACMCEAGYCERSIPPYVSAVLRQQKLRGDVIPEEIKDWREICLRAAKRFSGDAHRVLPFTSRMLLAFRGIPGFISDPQNVFLYRITTITFFFVLRSDEAVGSEEFRGLCETDFEFEEFSQKVTVLLGVTKTNTEGLICKRSLTCCCPSTPPTALDELLPVCPFHAAKALIADSQKSYDLDPEYCSPCSKKQTAPSPAVSSRTQSKKASSQSAPKAPPSRSDGTANRPLRPAPSAGRPSKAPKASQLLAFLRAGLALLGYDLVDPVSGRELYGTHSLRRGAAQALVAAGYSLEEIKFFGRWLSACIELYLLSVPMDTYGKDVSAAMIGFKNLSGVNSKSKESPDFVGCKPKVFSNQGLRTGMKILAHLPEFCLMTDLDEPEERESPILGWLEAHVLSVLPALPDLSKVEGNTQLEFHSSMSRHFPSDFTTLSARKVGDRCAVLRVSPDSPLLVVCFLSTLFSQLASPGQ